MRTLAKSVDAQRTEAAEERKYSRRTRFLTYLTIFSLVADLVLTGFVTYFSISATDLSNQVRHTQQSQYQACLDANAGRNTLESFFIGIFDQNLEAIKANPTHLPPAVINQQEGIINQYIVKTHQAFDPRDCSTLPH
jgi:hypothetical protein